MKNMKKLASLLLVMVMVLSLTAAAMADENTPHTITITTEKEGHTFQAYQVFKGTINEEGTIWKLSNIDWGNGVNSSALLAELITYDAYSKCKTADDVANVLKDRGDYVDAFANIVSKHLTTAAGSANTISTVTISENEVVKGYKISVTGDGYYFVKDADPVTGNDAATKYMLRVARDVTVGPKVELPTMKKKVKDINDSTGEATGWQDSADHDIGNIVSFQLTGKVAANYDLYNTYKFIFHDKESAGLTFKEIVSVCIDGTPITGGYRLVSSPTDGCTFEIVFDDLKTITSVHANSIITVEYTSTLNAGAVIGRPGNPNEAYLEFSNNPYDAQKTGTTPEDVVIVFTYKTIINKVHKVNNENVPLTGAEFTLEKFVSRTEGDSWVLVTATEKSTDGATFTFSGLDDGRYRLHESKTPTGYNSIEDIYFTITATHEILSDRPELTALTATETESGSATDKTDGLVFTPNLPNASLSADVLNNAGTTLPTTGGIGTTLFYVIGSVLVLAAVVLLVTKKRMNAQN